jgi:parvulin-like peptidyl-prolyl isomerase
VSAIPKNKRLPLIVSGAVVVLFLAGYAIFRGLGNPDVPSGDVATVEDAVPGTGTITTAAYDRALDQAAARGGVKQTPKPGNPQYDQLKQGAMNDLLDSVWIQGEAADLGITATADEVSSLLKQTISQNFRNQAEFEKFRKQSHFTTKDIRTRIRLQILSNKIQQQIVRGLPPVSQSQISEYYDEAKAQFTQPASRDVRLVLNKDKAKVEQAKGELEGDSSDASWKVVAAKFSTDPSSKSNGGLRPSITQGLLEQPLDREVFSAPQGQIEGPVHSPLGYYVFEVEKITPARTLPLNRSTRSQIGRQLTQQAQQNAFSAFVTDFGSKWRARTFCASDFLIERCDNFVGGGHPASAPAACYGGSSKGGIPPACPAPVTLLSPALPGTVSILAPQGTRLPQRPIPAHLPPATSALGAGLPPGAVPSTSGPQTGAAP